MKSGFTSEFPFGGRRGGRTRFRREICREVGPKDGLCETHKREEGGDQPIVSRDGINAGHVISGPYGMDWEFRRTEA